MFPTPVARDDGKSPEAHLRMKQRMPGGPRSTITSLSVLARAGFQQPMFPTPRAGKTTDEDEASWRARQERGDVATPPLSLAVKMIPTPTAGDSKSAAQAAYTEGAMHPGVTLTDYARQMLPTPRTTDVCSGRGATQINGRWYRPSKALEQGTLIGGANLADVAEATGQALPTPKARDWKHATGNEQRESPDLNVVAKRAQMLGQLNADWVELLMGWPSGWTRLPPGTGPANGKRSRGSRKAKNIASPDSAP